MDKLPTELLVEIADYASSSFNKSSLVSLSATNRHIRDVCIPVLFRSISLHEGIENSTTQIESLVESGLIRHVRDVRFGVVSFLAVERIRKIVDESRRRYHDDDWSTPPNSPYLTPSGWGASVPDLRCDPYPSYLEPSSTSSLISTLFSHTSSQLQKIEIRNVSTLSTPYVRSWDAAPSNKKEGTCDARDHIVMSLTACEGDLFSSLESASSFYKFPRLQALQMTVFKFMNTMPLVYNCSTLFQSAAVLSLDSIHPHPEWLDLNCGTYDHNHVMYLLSSIALSTSPTNGGSRKVLRLGFKNYPSSPIHDTSILPFPLVNGLSELSLENVLLQEGSLDKTIVSSPSLHTLRLRGIRMCLAHTLPSSSSSSEGDGTMVRRTRHAWGSLFSLCSTSLHGLVNLELYKNNYYNYRGESMSDEFLGQGMGDMLRSCSRADYQALKKLVETVRVRRVRVLGSGKYENVERGLLVPMVRHSR